jgi:hypothetical protein
VTEAITVVELALPTDLANLSLPPGVQKRLQFLLDKQDDGQELSEDERLEAEGLVDLADMLTLLRLRATRP